MASLETSQGIWYSDLYGFKKNALILGKNLFELKLKGNVACSYKVSNIKVIFNGDTVFRDSRTGYAFTISLAEKVGLYEVLCDHSHPSYKCTWTFELLPAIQSTLDQTFAVESPTTEIPVIVSEKDHRIHIFPNPTTDFIRVVNESENIRNITLYDEQGRIVNVIEPYGVRAELPLRNHPAGTYLLKVCTISEKITIRKILIL